MLQCDPNCLRTNTFASIREEESLSPLFVAADRKFIPVAKKGEILRLGRRMGGLGEIRTLEEAVRNFHMSLTDKPALEMHRICWGFSVSSVRCPE
jgi:hypothetical protein